MILSFYIRQYTFKFIRERTDNQWLGIGAGMQPVYVTLSSSGSSPWRLANWHAAGPQQFGFAVLSTGGSNWQIDVALEDPTNVYPSPNSSSPTAFALITASSTTAANQIAGLTSIAIAAWRLTVNTLSSVGARINLAALQAGIG
jgi:hypothetical protein